MVLEIKGLINHIGNNKARMFFFLKSTYYKRSMPIIGLQCVHVWLTRPRDRRSTLVDK